jgi:hypothetical protein
MRLMVLHSHIAHTGVVLVGVFALIMYLLFRFATR